MTFRRFSLASLAAVAGLVLALGVAVVPAYALDAPINVRGVISTQTRLQIAWDAVRDATHYQVNFASNPNFTGGVIAKPIGSTTYVLPDLTSAKLSPGTTYYFKVGAVSSTGSPLSGWSATASYATKPKMVISVGSFNVKDPGSDDPRWADWPTRASRSAKALVDQGTMVIGLQELYSKRDDYLGRINYWASQAGKGRPYAMTTDPDCDDSCGNDNRVVYDTRIFTLLGSTAVKYGSQYCPGGDCESPRMYVRAVLKHRATGLNILFATTHLSPNSDSVDVAQWEQLRTQLLQYKQVSSVPISYIVVTGDFNTTKFESPASTQLSRMRSSGLEDVLGQVYSSWTSTYRNPSARVDAWICSSNGGNTNVRGPRCTAPSTSQNAGSIDYIFVSKALKATYYRVYAQPRTGYVMNYLTSDHYLVRATISQ